MYEATAGRGLVGSFMPSSDAWAAASTPRRPTRVPHMCGLTGMLIAVSANAEDDTAVLKGPPGWPRRCHPGRLRDGLVARLPGHASLCAVVVLFWALIVLPAPKQCTMPSRATVLASFISLFGAWASASTPVRPTWLPTSPARTTLAPKRTTTATLFASPTMRATTWATLRAWGRTYLAPSLSRRARRWCLRPRHRS